MKVSIFVVVLGLFAVCANGLSLKDISEISVYASECMIRHKINPLTVKRLKDGDLSKNDEKNQCFVNCIMEKIGLLKDGELTINDSLLKHANDDTATRIFNACQDTKGANDCETAFKLYECYLNNKSHQQ